MQPQIQSPKSLDEHIHSIAEKIAEEKNKDNIKKDTRAIKKKLIKTMNPLDDEDEGEEEKLFKFKIEKQPSLNTKINDLELQNNIISSELEEVEHQNEAVRSCCADIEDRLNAMEVVAQSFEERLATVERMSENLELMAPFCKQLKSKIDEMVRILNSNDLKDRSPVIVEEK
jgi:chromosome segregation ATPase